MNNISTYKKGKTAEQLAIKYLISKGYHLLTQNYRSHYGEIDIIAREGKTIVFVEVKSNIKYNLSEPQIRVDNFKQKRLTLVANDYLVKHSQEGQNFRFDVLALKKTIRGEWEITHIIDAFRPEDINNLI